MNSVLRRGERDFHIQERPYLHQFCFFTVVSELFNHCHKFFSKSVVGPQQVAGRDRQRCALVPSLRSAAPQLDRYIESTMRKSIFFIILLAHSFCYANPQPIQIFPLVCEAGEYLQPNGDFSLYVFCDDGTGTNIAVIARNIDSPKFVSSEDYCSSRFWQEDTWSRDVNSFAWLNQSELLISTSGIYGNSSVYILDLYKKTYKIVYQNPGANIVVNGIQGTEILIEFEGPDRTIVHKKIPM